MKKIYSLLVFSFIILSLQAQDLTIEGAVIVQADGLIFVQGNVLIKPGGTLDIESSGPVRGKVHVDATDFSVGDWVCNGTTSGTGEVKFLGGSVDYEVSGSNVSFPHLILDFGSIQAGIIPDKMNLNGDVTVTESLDFVSGRVVTNNNEIYVANNASGSITGNFGLEKSRFIEGTLRREVTTGPNNYYLYPIGSETIGYNPASIDLRDNINPQIPAGVNNIAGRFIEMNDIGDIGFMGTTNNCYFTTAIQFLEFYWMVKSFGYWDFGPDGDSTGWNYDFYAIPNKDVLLTENPGLTHLKVFKAPGSFNPGPGENWGPFFYDSGDHCNGVNIFGNDFYWLEPGPPGSPFYQTDSIAAWGLKSFSRYGLGGGTGAALPIELLYLEATPVNNTYINVHWATATEINNMGFEVLRSVDGVNFTQIGWRDGAGNSSVTLGYNFPDYDVEPNKLYYYRLHQIDFDGTTELTYIVSAMITSSNVFTISEFFPNPSENDSRIQVITSTEKKLNITVFNTLGQSISRFDHTVVPGTNTIDFNFNMLADGTYFAIIRADKDVYNRKLILTK